MANSAGLVDFASYLAELQARGLRVFADGYVEDYDHVVATVWDRSFEAVAEQSLTAVAVLEVLGVLAPAPLPLAVLRADEAAEGEAPGWGRFVLAEALGAVSGYSLVDAGGEEVVVHRLVHRRIGERTDAEARAAARQVAIALLDAAFPPTPACLSRGRRPTRCYPTSAPWSGTATTSTAPPAGSCSAPATPTP